MKLLVGGYLTVSAATFVAIVLLRDHTAVVDSAVWIRGTVVVASAVAMLMFTVRAARGSRRMYLRLRIVSAVMVVAIAVIAAMPGILPLWMRKYKGGHPPKFTLAQRREIKKIAKARPGEYDLPFSTWSLSRLAEFLVAEGVDRRHQPRGAAGAAPRGGRHLSAPENVEPPKTRSMRRRRPGSSTCTRSPTVRCPRAPATPGSYFASMSSGR